MNPIFYIDFYKVGHAVQYPDNVTKVWSNWTPRYSRVSDQKFMIHFGIQYFILKYLVEEFNTNFFSKTWEEIESEYRDVISTTLFVKYEDVKVDHIKMLWMYGRLPLNIYSLPEGTKVPLNVPAMVLVNTEDWAFWLPNYIETLMSNIMWKPSTSATTAYRYRKLFENYANLAGETDLTFIDWMGHDFSMRGMSGLEDAILSGLGHLLSFSGTDSIPAILAAQKYYQADLSIGGSVPATEHSVMCSGAKYLEDGSIDEFEMFQRLITEIYPSGVVSIVSDSFDLWKVLTNYIPRLKTIIQNRNGKIVIRPDSGDPVKIVCGDSFSSHPYASKGTLQLLRESLGIVERPGKLDLINGAGCIYGDAITLERANQILGHMVNNAKLSPYNMVFGIGSFTYEYVTRDTYGLAMKATAIEQVNSDGSRVIRPIFKKPITDDGGKISHKGIVSVHKDENGLLTVKQNSSPEDLNNCEYELFFEDGEPRFESFDTFDDIRTRVRMDY